MRTRRAAVLLCLAAAGLLDAARPAPAAATILRGDFQLAGKLVTQNHVRFEGGIDQLALTMQRNTLQLEPANKLVKGGKAFGLDVPLVRDVRLRMIYRSWYDSVIEFTPGPRPRDQHGRAVAGSCPW